MRRRHQPSRLAHHGSLNPFPTCAKRTGIWWGGQALGRDGGWNWWKGGGLVIRISLPHLRLTHRAVRLADLPLHALYALELNQHVPSAHQEVLE